MGVNAELVKLMGPQLEVVLPELDEKSRRLVLAAVARAAGDGGITAVAKVAGASWQTVADGVAELESGQVAPAGRVRRPGAGRKKLAETDPGLVPALLALVEDSSRGDPESPLVWTTKSTKNLSGELGKQGHRCSPQTAWRLLHEQGFSTQANAKVTEGRRHPDRDAQFRYIAAQAQEHLAAGQPVISVDAKKKEQVGEHAQAGREWRPQGDPVKVRDHSFDDGQGGHAIPYGIYDVAANTGFVNVGTDHNTAAFAVESIRRWWAPGRPGRLPGRGAAAGHLRRRRGQRLAQPGLEGRAGALRAGQRAGDHRLPFPARYFEVEQGRAPAVLPDHLELARPPADQPRRHHQHHRRGHHGHRADRHRRTRRRTATPPGVQVSDEQMRDLEDRALTRHRYHGEWNYTFLPVPRPAPPPPPAPPEPVPAPPGGLCDPALLNQPALTGLDPAALDALAAALALPAAARHEQQLYTRRGGQRRRRPASRPDPRRKLSLRQLPPGHLPAPAPRHLRHRPRPPARRRPQHPPLRHRRHPRPARPGRARHPARPRPHPHPGRPAPLRRQPRHHHPRPRTTPRLAH